MMLGRGHGSEGEADLMSLYTTQSDDHIVL